MENRENCELRLLKRENQDMTDCLSKNNDRVCSVPFVSGVSNATSREQTLHLAMKKNWRNVEENYFPSHLKREEKEKNQILIETSNCSNN